MNNRNVGLGEVFGSVLGVIGTVAVRGASAIDSSFDVVESGLNTTNNLVSTAEVHSASFKRLSEIELEAKIPLLEKRIQQRLEANADFE